MKKISASIFSALTLSLIVATTVFAAFTNGGFESGNFTGWTKSTFLNDLYPNRAAGGSDLTEVLGPNSTFSQTDPYSDGVLKYPPYGNYVARVNSEFSYLDGGFPRNGNTLTQNATVEATDVDPADGLVHVRFVYSGVMVNPVTHADNEKPYIYVVVKNLTKGGDILYEFQSYAGEPGKGWVQTDLFRAPDDYWQYLDWQFVDIPESVGHPVDVGDVIYVEVTAAGCEPSGHPGYAYVDEFSFLKPAPILTATDNPDPIDVGATLTYTFNYKAINAVANPVIQIPVPFQTTFSSVSDTTHCSYSAITKKVTCNMPDLAAGASGAPFTVKVTVNSSAAGDTLTLKNYTIQGTSTNVNTGSPVTTTVNALKPAPTITASDSPDPVDPGATLTYTFNYQAIDAVTNPVIQIPIPFQTTFSSISDTTHCSYSAANKKVTCNMPDLGAGASGAPFTMDVTVNSSAAGDLITLANYTIQGDATTLRTGAQVKTTVNAATNNPPNILEGNNAAVTMSEDGAPVPFSLTLHATDPEGDTLTWSRLTKPKYGRAWVEAATGVVHYKPYINYYGDDSFDIQVSDGALTDTVTVDVTVTPVNDPDFEASAFWLIYNGWRHKHKVQYFLDSYITSEEGQFSLYVPSKVFKFTLTAATGPDQGIMELQVDGSTVQTVDLYSPAPADVQVVLDLPVGQGKKVAVVATGTKRAASTGTWVTVDSYQFNSQNPIDVDLNLVHWNKVARPDSYHYRLSGRAGSNMVYRFTGQRVVWSTYRGPDAGIVQVFKDGELLRTIDLYNDFPLWDQKYVFGPYPYGTHVLEFRIMSITNPLSSGTIVIVDRMDKE